MNKPNKHTIAGRASLCLALTCLVADTLLAGCPTCDAWTVEPINSTSFWIYEPGAKMKCGIPGYSSPFECLISMTTTTIWRQFNWFDSQGGLHWSAFQQYTYYPCYTNDTMCHTT